LLALAIGLLISGCSSSGTSSKSGSSAPADAGSGAAQGSTADGSQAAAQAIVDKFSKAPTSIQITEPLKAAPAKGKTFIYLAQNNVPTAVTTSTAIRTATEAIGWKFSQLNFDQANPASIQSALSTALIKHPTAVGMIGVDPTQVGVSTVKSYESGGVALVFGNISQPGWSFGKAIIGSTGGDTSYANYANALAAWFAIDSGGKGKAVLASTQGISILKTFSDAFVADTKKFCPGCSVKVVPVPIASALGGQTNQLIVSNLRSNPSYKYVFYDDGPFSDGINSALSGAGLTGIKVGGNDINPEQAGALAAGTQYAWTGMTQTNIGYTMVDTALRWLQGMSLTADNNNPQPTQLLTKANVAGTRTVFDKPANALDQWKKLWHVS
jgi:ribose transport system substrate-binding protein